MPQLTTKNILIAGVVGVVILGGILFYSSGKLQKPARGSQEQIIEQEVFSAAGKVVSTNVADNSFVLLQPKEEREFVVKLGTETEFIRLIFPFDIANPPAEATFTPKREPVTIADLKENDQVFIRSSHGIKTKQDIVNPLEIQVLP